MRARPDRRRLGLLSALVAAAALVLAAPAAAAPVGLTATAQEGGTDLEWQPVRGASGYIVERGSSADAITRRVSPAGLTGDSFTDTSAPTGDTSFYRVSAVVDGEQTGASSVASATPRAATCSAGNRIERENCLPGGIGWKIANPAQVSAGGIEGFATSTSINVGESVGLKVNAQAGAPYRIEIWRTGWYGGTQARLVGTLDGLTGVAQPACSADAGTGLRDCSNWSTSAVLSTSSAWVSGVYLLRLVRPNTGGENHILLTVRDDAAPVGVVFNVPVSTYQAYNNYGGKSLYDYNSSGATTVAGTPRAVKVSHDRPYNLPYRDWYTSTDIAAVAWLESQGYNVKYVTNDDLHTGATSLLGRRALILGAHDEYWSAPMRAAVTAARNAGTGLFWLGANAVYWKVRYEASPVSGAPNRVVVAYKSTQSGPADPSGDPTGTWRDPLGANFPENALVGQQYIGDNDFGYFPLVVSAAESQHRVWRNTTLAASGTGQSIGSTLVGWEWDAPTANGFQPAGLQVVATSPVNGQLLTDHGGTYSPPGQPARAYATYYRASSGATVFATGTNHWARGLSLNMDGVGEPNEIIQQATVNVLEDMGALRGEPDPFGAPGAPTSSPGSGAANTGAAPKGAPMSIKVRRVSLLRALRRGLVVRLYAPRAGTLGITARHGSKLVGKGKRRARRAGPHRVTVRFTRQARRTLSRKRTVKLTLRSRFTPKGAKRATKTGLLRITLKR